MAAPPNREIHFDFDSFVRAGEAKLCGCLRDMPPHRWGCDCQKAAARSAAGSECFFMLYALVLSTFGRLLKIRGVDFVHRHLGFK